MIFNYYSLDCHQFQFEIANFFFQCMQIKVSTIIFYLKWICLYKMMNEFMWTHRAVCVSNTYQHNTFIIKLLYVMLQTYIYV